MGQCERIEPYWELDDMARTVDVNQWAKLGAAARLKEIQEELASIYQAFPELRGKRGFTAVASSGGRQKRKRFSAAGKAAISEGMRKYWARRKAKAAKAAAK
jgi:ABC-type branched-subunit amino acid transport system ATPase component